MNNKFVFFGNDEFSLVVLKELLNNALKPSLIVTQGAKPRGRGLKIKESPIFAFAKENNLEVAVPVKLKGQDFLKELSNLNPAFGIIASFGRIIPDEILDIFRQKVFNVHPSLLPRFRGASPIQSTILADEKKTGISVILTTDKVDEGPIMAQKEIGLRGDETYIELFKKLAKLGGELMVYVIKNYGNLKPCLQDNKKAVLTGRLSKESGFLDFQESAMIIERRIRALNPWPGTFCYISTSNKKKLLKILEAEVVENVPGFENLKVNSLFIDKNQNLLIRCGEGFLKLKKLQLEGKNPIDAKSFVGGYGKLLPIVLN